jgi:16S rRNA processing protein RimM
MTEGAAFDLVVGEVGGAHGIRGEVRVRPLTDHPEHFAELQEVYLEWSPDRGREVTIERVRFHQGVLLVQFAGTTTRTEAEQLLGAMVCVPREAAVPLAEGEYFCDQIVGLEAVTTTGESLGPITEVLRTGANDVYVTARALIPALPDVVKEVDCAGGRVVIEAIPGLLPD